MEKMSQHMEHRIKAKVKSGVEMAFKVFFGILFAIGFALLMAFAVKGLWNWLMPGLFGFKPLSFWQATGLLVLARILVGGLGGDHSRRKFKKSKKKQCPADTKHFSKWKFYDEFWEKEGQQAFDAYIDRLQEKGKIDDEPGF